MASKAVAGFQLPNGPGLGIADTGQPWVKHRGNGEIRTGRAYFTKSSPGSLWTVDTGAGGGNATVECDFLSGDGGGQALYFRVSDVNHWWRFAKRKYTYTYTYVSGYTDPVYGWVGTGTYYYEPAGGWVKTGESTLDPTEGAYGTYQTVYYSYDSRVSTYLGRQDYVYDKVLYYQWRTVHENQTYTQIGGGDPIYSTATSTAAAVDLDKCVNGIVYPIKTASVSDTTARLTVILNNDTIDCFAGTVRPWDAISDPAHSKASKHGVGFSERSEYGNSGGIESFVATPSVISGYVPHLIL